jgi:hypothetical protein
MSDNIEGQEAAPLNLQASEFLPQGMPGNQQLPRKRFDWADDVIEAAAQDGSQPGQHPLQLQMEEQKRQQQQQGQNSPASRVEKPLCPECNKRHKPRTSTTFRSPLARAATAAIRHRALRFAKNAVQPTILVLGVLLLTRGKGSTVPAVKEVPPGGEEDEEDNGEDRARIPLPNNVAVDRKLPDLWLAWPTLTQLMLLAGTSRDTDDDGRDPRIVDRLVCHSAKAREKAKEKAGGAKISHHFPCFSRSHEDSTEYSRASQGARRFFFEKQMAVGDLDGIKDIEERRKLTGI